MPDLILPQSEKAARSLKSPVIIPGLFEMFLIVYKHKNQIGLAFFDFNVVFIGMCNALKDAAFEPDLDGVRIIGNTFENLIDLKMIFGKNFCCEPLVIRRGRIDAV